MSKEKINKWRTIVQTLVNYGLYDLLEDEIATVAKCLQKEEEQQKEIEELKEKYSKKLIEFQKEREWYEKNHISKDKIREKIEELDSIYQQEIKQQYNGRYYHQLSYAIQELQSLLEED